jgi:hypothetical protein
MLLNHEVVLQVAAEAWLGRSVWCTARAYCGCVGGPFGRCMPEFCAHLRGVVYYLDVLVLLCAWRQVGIMRRR